MSAGNLRIVLVFLLACCLSVSAAQPVTPEIKCPRVDQAPVIDGMLTDPCWQKAARVDGFFPLSAEKKLSPATTTAWVAGDDAHLYVAFDCKLLPGEEVRAEERPRDGRVWSDDDVEVFLTLDGRAFFQFIVNACGSVYDGWSDGAKQHSRWDSDFRAAASARKDGWSAEMAVPLHSLQLKPSDPKTWGILLCRGESPRKRLSSWPYIGEGGFHQVEKSALLHVPFDLSPYACTVTGDAEASLTLGHNVLDLFVRNQTDRPRTVTVETTVRQDSRQGGSTHADVHLDPNQQRTVRAAVDVPIAWQDSPAPVTVEARLRDSVTGKTMSLWGVHADLPPPFSFSTDQSVLTMGQRELFADARVNVGARGDDEFLLRFSVTDEDGRPVLQQSRVCGAGVSEVGLDISRLGPGRFDLSVSLLDRRGVTISSASTRLMKYLGPFDAPAR